MAKVVNLMASKCYCDFCGKELGERWDYSKDFVGFRVEAGNSLVANYYIDTSLHLCKKCAKELVNHIKSYVKKKAKVFNEEDWKWNEGW